MSNGDGLVGIGSFAVLSGLSIPALRHYDDLGILKPAVVEQGSGYRRYQIEQVRAARLIRSLRAVDMPIDGIRAVIAAGDDDASVGSLLRAHREGLVARRDGIARMLGTIDEYIENGVRMTNPTSARVVEINLGVEDLDAARRFYEAVFAVTFNEERHDDGPVHLFAAFGSWPSDEFFLLNISAASNDPYRAGRADFGFLVDDLEATHKRALAAGGTELAPPADHSGMPRCATIVDPGGNVINLYQNA